MRNWLYLAYVAVAVIFGTGMAVSYNDPAAYVAVFIAMFAPGIVLGTRRANNASPRGITTRLLKQGPQSRIERRLESKTASTWNPARPYPGGNVFGEGLAIYQLDNQQMRLEWRPRHGDPAVHVGPLPKGVDPAARARRRRAAGTALGVYLTSAAVGYVTVYASASGPRVHREATGLFGAVGGYFAAYLAALAIIVITRSRQAPSAGASTYSEITGQ